jgi:hypothetical protein
METSFPPEGREDVERLMADANALDRLALTEEWKVLDRLLGEHVARLLLALRQRGLGFAETDALRAEIEAVEWLRYRPIALRRAVTEHEAMERQRAATAIDPSGVKMR